MINQDYKDKIEFFIEGQLKRRRPQGLRVVATYKCNRRCPFCYQRNQESDELNVEKLEFICETLKAHDWVPVYVTFQGGEIAFCNHSRDYYDIVHAAFPHTFRKGITTNGDAGFDYYESLKMNGITSINFSLHDTSNLILLNKIKESASDGFYNVRVNCFLDENNIQDVKDVYNFCKDNNIQLTLCEDQKSSNNTDYIEYNILPEILFSADRRIRWEVKRNPTHLYVVADGFPFWVYLSIDNYEYNNIVVLPNGELTMRYDDIKECEGAN